MRFTFHQALFGYDGGHQLLAASLQLPTEARHSLAVATDLSGSPPPVGFDRCYAGAPVPGTSFYTLFCTWLAPEMPRPGCVWSHAVLIDLADLAELRDLGGLRELFRRPSGTSNLDAFSRPRAFTDKELAGPPLSQLDPLAARLLLRALYGDPEKSVVVTAELAPEYEDLIFAMWSQQWPRLRRNFRFSTGSFSDRGRAGVAFDLQVTPEANASSWRGNRVLSLHPAKLLRTGQSPNGDEAWLAAALNDLLGPGIEDFRTFLRTYGADVKSPRAAFKGIADMYHRFGVTDQSPWSDTLRAIAAEFPMPDDAQTLKRVSVSPFLSMPKDVMTERLVDSIRFLCLGDSTQAFARTEVDFGAAVADVWPSRRNAIWDLFAEPPSNEAKSTALLKAVASQITGDDLVILAETHPELIASLVRLKPIVAGARDVWRLGQRSQWAVIEGLEGANVSTELWRAITGAMLEAGTTIGVREVVNLAGKAALDGALEWLVHASPSSLPTLWREVLRRLAEERLEGEMLRPVELAFCTSIASPAIVGRMSASRPDVQALASEPLESLPLPLQLHTAFLLMTLGLQASPQAGAPLIARGFFAVHDALEGAVEPPEAWRLLQPYLPIVWFWQEWDRCFRLRRALQQWLHNHPETRSTIASGVRNPDDRRLLESLW